MSTWIKLHRNIKKHWLWTSELKLKWWIDILITVNFADSKVLIKGTLYDCNRGQSLQSLDTWARQWNVSKSTVKDFFTLLESDQMITTENIKVSTRLTVCKYDEYQITANATQTEVERNSNGSRTQDTPNIRSKEREERKEEKKKKLSIEEKDAFIAKIQGEFYHSLTPYFGIYPKDEIDKFYNYWSESNTALTKIKWQMEPTWDLHRRLERWMKNNKEFNTKFTKPNNQLPNGQKKLSY